MRSKVPLETSQTRPARPRYGLSAGRAGRGIGQSTCGGTAADSAAHRRCDRVWSRLPDPPALKSLRLLAALADREQTRNLMWSEPVAAQPPRAYGRSVSQIPSGFLTVLTIGLVVAFLYFARDVVIPITLAILLSFLLAPAVRWLRRWHLGRVPAVTLTV